MARTPTQRLRRSFSLAPGVKHAYPGTKSREELCFLLAGHYEDALFSDEHDTHDVIVDGVTFEMFPTRKSDTKIRVRMKQ